MATLPPIMSAARRRILILATWYPSDDTPVLGTFVEDQAVALAERYDVTVLAPVLENWRSILPGRASRALERETRRGVAVYRPHARAVLPGSEWFARNEYLRVTQRAYRRIVEERGEPDLIHAHVTLLGGWAATRLAADASIPVVLTEHSGPFSMHLSTAARRKLTRETLEAAARVIAVGPGLADEVAAAGPTERPIEVIGNIVDTDYFSPAPAHAAVPRPFRFVSVALLDPQKGVDTLLRAVARLHSARTRPFELVILGGGQQRGALERLARELGVSQLVTFAGTVDRDVVRDTLRASDCFVLASREETFGVALAEAMASGLPVIASATGGARYLVEPGTGTLVAIGDPAQLAEAMSKALGGRLGADGDRARESIVRRFKARAIVDRLATIYDAALERRAAVR
jgi:L-malate glycosyltransferase